MMFCVRKHVEPTSLRLKPSLERKDGLGYSKKWTRTQQGVVNGRLLTSKGISIETPNRGS